jgi:hypothetical protein
VAETYACHIYDNTTLCVISGFRHQVEEIRALLGYYAASSGYFVTTFQNKLSAASSRVKKSDGVNLLNLESATDRMFRNISKKLPLNAA